MVSFCFYQNKFIILILYLATKYSNDINEEHQHLAEMKLAIVKFVNFYLNKKKVISFVFRLGIKLITQKIIFLMTKI